MIIVRFTSGLGNQMFQYNFYRLMQETYPQTTVAADTRWLYRNDPHLGYELPVIFPKLREGSYAVKEASLAECFKVSGQLQGLSHSNSVEAKWARLSGGINKRLRNGIMAERFAANNIDDSTGLVTDELYNRVMNLDPGKDYYISSYWAYEMYYKDRLPLLQDELTMDEPCDEKNISMLNMIDGSNSVSIHIRRGDYLNPENIDKFIALDNTYYSAAISCIKERVDNPKFFVFSDDIESARKVLAGCENAVYVSHNTGADSFRDMQLMSRCKHNIIANSTFSQWGALLNRNEGHITIYPAAYMYGEDTEERTLPGWVRMTL